MITSIDGAGRVVIPKAMRDALGLAAGSDVEVSIYGAGLQLTPGSRTARLVKVGGRLLADSSRTVTDEDVFLLIDSERR